MRALAAAVALLPLLLAAGGTCNQSGAPPSPPPSPSPSGAPTAMAGTFVGVPQDAMACQLVEHQDGVVLLLCDVRARFAPYAAAALAGLACLPPAGSPSEPAGTVACVVLESASGPLRLAIDRGP